MSFLKTQWKKQLPIGIFTGIVFYFVDKCFWLYRQCVGNSLFDKLGVMFLHLELLFYHWYPSLYLTDLLGGFAGAAIFLVYFRYGKNATPPNARPKWRRQRPRSGLRTWRKAFLPPSASYPGRSRATTVEYIGGIEVIKAFNQADNSYQKFTDAVHANADLILDWMKDTQKYSAIMMSVWPAALISVLPVGCLFYMSGSLSAATFITVTVLSLGIAGPLVAAMFFTDDIAKIGTVMGEIDGILNQPELVRPEAITPKAWQREIDQLIAGKQTDTLAMKSMREDLKAVERLRKTAEQLSRQERDKSHDRGPER